MKKILAFLLALISVCSLFCFAGCEGEEKTIKIAVPDGAPVLAIYNVLKNQEKIGGYNVEVEILDGASNIAAVMTNGGADVAVMPTNIASKLYNSGVDIKLASVNVFGVLYMIGKNPIDNLSDLIGSVIVYTGAGGTPELTLKLILDRNQIPYEESQTPIEGKVALTPVVAGSEAIAMVKTAKANYAVLGEPVVTQANANLGTNVVLDLTSEWIKLVGENSYMQAGVVLSDSVYNKGVFVRGLMETLNGNKALLEEDYENVVSVLERSGSSLRVKFTADTVKRLNVGHLTAVESRQALEKYYGALMEYNKKLIGGKLPDDGFYLNYEK